MRTADRVTAMQCELVRLARTDFLTGLFNRRAFFEDAAKMVVRAQYGHGVSAIMFDLDHFKRINDIHGHDIGDAVLRRVAKEIAPLPGITGRLGGEEFAVLMEGDLSDAADTAQEFRCRIENVKIFAGEQPVALTCSLGVAEWEAGDTIDTLLRRADVALYEAKRTGRNKVAIYSDGAFARLATWLENEIAQTCGSGEAGLLPVVGEGVRQGYGADRLFISYSQGDVLPLGQLADAGHPTARFQITDPSELGREMVRLQIALAGVSALGDGALPGEFGPNELEAETGRILAAGGQERRATDGKEAGLEQALRAIEKMVRGLGEGSHVRISAYLDEKGDQAKAAAEFRGWLAGLTMAPVTFGFALGGLASAGRFHPPRWRSCALVQLLDRSTSTPIPGRGYGFSDLIGAEAKAERTMLERRGRPVVTVELNEFDAAAMSQLVDAARSARRA